MQIQITKKTFVALIYRVVEKTFISETVFDPKPNLKRHIMKNTNQNNSIDDLGTDEKLPKFLIYPASEDIYAKMKKEEAINPSDPSKMKSEATENEILPLDELGSLGNRVENDLDIPGVELDDVQENIGSEDEENNYYSLGGDNHNDLEESDDTL
jgi:hypothetical protein